jgi:glycosyltransferase involved in cell wall biosynthesis
MPATDELQATATAPPPILYLCDFPPSNRDGGSVLVDRLLAEYPPENIVAFTSSRYHRPDAQTRHWSSHHAVLWGVQGQGRWGIGRAKGLVNWLLIPLIALRAALQLRRRRASAILSVAHGTYFIAAALASALTSVPLILIVHDDWVADLQRNSYFFKYIARRLFQSVLHRASHVFAVSPPMQRLLRSEYGVDAELQMPCAEAVTRPAGVRNAEGSMRHCRILYAGNGICGDDCLRILMELLQEDRLAGYGLSDWELHLYTPSLPGAIPPRTTWHGWVSQAELAEAVASADILFLPYSFLPDGKSVRTTSFPAKTADYLASGRPILIFSPPDSTIVEYAREFDFACIVTEPAKDALAAAIGLLCCSEVYRGRLAANALRTLAVNHSAHRQRQRLYDVLAETTDASQRPASVSAAGPLNPEARRRRA